MNPTKLIQDAEEAISQVDLMVIEPSDKPADFPKPEYRNSYDPKKVLRWLKYFDDTLREHNMIWGVGRGSSVASYVLFLLGVHRVDALEFELDIKEFLK